MRVRVPKEAGHRIPHPFSRRRGAGHLMLTESATRFLDLVFKDEEKHSFATSTAPRRQSLVQELGAS
jgi:hypothetical protein